MNTGKNRIQARISEKIYAEVLKVLQQMAREGKSPLEVGRYLHSQYCGQLWQWLRIARSEPVLAYNAAFDEQSKAAGAQYEEWNCASGACDICSAFDGRIWKIGEGPQPVSCVLAYCQIMTVDGWKQIKDIKLGELVLTHTGKFRQVTKLYRHKKTLQRMAKIHYKNIPYAAKRKGEQSVSLEITDNHPVYIEGDWIAAGNLKAGDRIRLLATRCPVCDKLQPYSRWRNVHGDKANFCSMNCSNVVMDNWVHRPKEETVAIRKKISDFKKENNPMHNEEYRLKMGESQKERLKNPAIIKQMSESRLRFHNENPGFAKEQMKKFKEKDPERYWLLKKHQSKALVEFWKKFPEKIPTKNFKRVSKGHIKFFELIKQFYPDAKLEYYIKTNVGSRFGDVVLPDKRIVLEYDGKYWHQNKDKDLQRDLELQFKGWTILHFDEDNWRKAPEQIERLLKNHNNEYEFIDIEVSKIEFSYRKNVELFNLEVAEDESYIAKGIVVHNCTHPHCLCIRLARFTMPVDKPLQQAWSRVSPYEQAYNSTNPNEVAGLGNFLNNNIIGIPRPGLGGMPGMPGIPTGGGFIPANSIREAEEWAIRNGLANIVDYKKMDVELANIINKKLNELNKTGIAFNEIVPIKGKAAKNKVFSIKSSSDARTNELTRMSFEYSPINAGGMSKIKKTISQLENSGLLRNINIDKMITHEYGHVVDVINSERFRNTGWILDDFIRNKIGNENFIIVKNNLKRKIGEYFNTNTSEQFAELYRLYKYNELPEELKFLNTYFNGLKP